MRPIVSYRRPVGSTLKRWWAWFLSTGHNDDGRIPSCIMLNLIQIGRSPNTPLTFFLLLWEITKIAGPFGAMSNKYGLDAEIEAKVTHKTDKRLTVLNYLGQSFDFPLDECQVRQRRWRQGPSMDRWSHRLPHCWWLLERSKGRCCTLCALY